MVLSTLNRVATAEHLITNFWLLAERRSENQHEVLVLIMRDLGTSNERLQLIDGSGASTLAHPCCANKPELPLLNVKQISNSVQNVKISHMQN